jgi:acyl carrier protein
MTLRETMQRTQTVLDVIERETGVKADAHTTLEELGVDSLDLLDLMLALSVETGHEYEHDALTRLETVADILKVFDAL